MFLFGKGGGREAAGWLLVALTAPGYQLGLHVKQTCELFQKRLKKQLCCFPGVKTDQGLRIF